MRHIIFIYFILAGFTSFGQKIGINNTNPQNVLDINGQTRIRPKVMSPNISNNIVVPDSVGYLIISASASFTVSPVTTAIGSRLIIENNTGFQGELGSLPTIILEGANEYLLDTSNDWVRVGPILANSWNIEGNEGTTPGLNFIGTSDNIDLSIKTNNLERIRVKNNGSIGIGLTGVDPSALLQLHSTSKGFTLPRMFQADRTSIVNPIQGLMVYENGSGIFLNKSEGSHNWVKLSEGNNYWTNHPVNTNDIYNNNSGNIAIGTTQALQKLTVAGGITVDATGLKSGGVDNTLKFGSDNSSVFIRSNRTSSPNQLGLDLATGSATRIAITSNGNVGIGTSTPANRMDVEGGSVIGVTYSGTNTAPANGLLVEGNTGLGTTTPVNKLDIEGGVAIGASYSGTNTAPTNGLLVQGNVGIGTTSPLTRLHVKGNGYGLLHSDNADTVQVGSYISTNAGWFGTKTNHPLHFFTNDGTPKMTLGINGNLGIGTQTPHNFAALEISSTNKGVLLPRLNNIQMTALGTAAPDGTIVYNTDQSGLFLRRAGSFVKLIDVAATLNLPFSALVNSSSNLFTVQNSGTGGAIWASTASNTDVAVRAETSGSSRALEAISTSGIAAFVSTNSSANTALVVSLGKTGLGTSSPANQLDVEGATAIGAAYSGTSTAPANGLIVQGTVGIGTNSPSSNFMLDVNGRMRLRHNVNTSGLWFNKSNNTEEGFIGMISDSTIGIWGSSGGANWRNGFNLRNGNFGINVSNPLKPLSFDNNLGNKIALWGNADVDHYGFGIQASTMRMYVPTNTARFEFGYGNANTFNEVARLTAGGQFLLGTNSSNYRNHIKAPNSNLLMIENSVALANAVDTRMLFKTGNYFTGLIRTVGTGTASARLSFYTNAHTNESFLFERMSITNGGDVLIGLNDETSGVGYKLRVKGKIIAEELKVQLEANWPDYVFHKNYNLMSLANLEKYIHENNHLPNIPAASEIEDNGLEVGEMQRKMMEKIEELTLHIIELNKKLEAQQDTITELKKSQKQ